MAKKRFVETTFWTDPYIQDLDPSEKLLYLYCFTNNSSDLCWIYEISLKTISFDTWFEKDMVLKIINRFAKDHKIYYINWWIYVKNFIKHQSSNPSIQKGIERSLESIPDDILEETKRLANISHSWQTATDCDSVCTGSALLTPTPTPTLTPIDQNSDENNLVPCSPKHKKEKKRGDVFSIKELEEEWETFRNLYPKKVAKKKAKEAYFKYRINGIPAETMLKGLESYKHYLAYTEKTSELTKHPTTRLNGEHREDELDTWPTFATEQEEFNYLYDEGLHDKAKEKFWDKYWTYKKAKIQNKVLLLTKNNV